MIETTDLRRINAALVLFLLLWTGFAAADERLLIRIDKNSDLDRNALIEDGVTLVAETEDALLAIGAVAEINRAAAARSLTAEIVAEATEDGASFALVGLQPGFTEIDLLACGEVISRGDGWLLIQGTTLTTSGCLDSSGWFLRVLDLDPLAPIKPPPDVEPGRLLPNPLVQEMVDRVDGALTLSHWSALSESISWTTRHSRSQGCVDAASYVHDQFTSYGLGAEYQHHTDGYADNVIGTRLGLTEPDKVYIAIGHLDDLPSSGPAPGADDNASGTAMVTALAEIMSDYCFARTTKFIAVTGEEQGLYGSNHYADNAAASGEDIQAVLNGDMIGWEGDGLPAVENLDVNYNSGSQWLAQALIDAAGDYSTGLAINAFSCATMVASDHAPFWDNGFSAICGITDNQGYCGQTGYYPYYHQSSDTIANCGAGAVDFEAAVIRTYLATMAHLALPITRVPAPPDGIDVQPDGDNRIALSWSDQGPGASYQLYRSVGGCADPDAPVFIGETTSTNMVDTSPSGSVLYAYTLTTTVAGSCTSTTSVCVEATTTGLCDEPPRFIGIDTVESAGLSSCQLNLDWQPPQNVWCGGPVAYNVYRSATPNFTPSPVNRIAELVSTTTFYDYDVVDSEVYHYIVRAVDLAMGGEDDNIHDLAASPTGPNIVGPWFDDAGDTGAATMLPTSPWSVGAGAGLSGAGYLTGAYGNDVCAPLTSPQLPLGANPVLEFWTKHDIENSWDKGELQISTDAGSTWQRVPLSYPGSSSNTNDSCNLGTGPFFTGTDQTFKPYSADLSPWSNRDVSLRWLFSTDGSVNGGGWWIDNILITDFATCTTDYLIFADGFESGDTGAW